MHSGDVVLFFCRLSAPASLFVPVFSLISGKTLVLNITLCYMGIMKRVVIKVDRRDISFRITIPRKIIQQKMWNDVEYMLLEESGPDIIVLRRLIDGEALETAGQGCFPGFSR